MTKTAEKKAMTVLKKKLLLELPDNEVLNGGFMASKGLVSNLRQYRLNGA
jgi:hypothetical protein